MSFHSLIGLMSGTSMDGLDIVFCSYTQSEDKTWQHTVFHTNTLTYSDKLLAKLKRASTLTAPELFLLDKELGHFFANAVNNFITENNIERDSIDAIASHGHTIFHQPEKGFTVQIGCGDTLAFHTGIKVINDFRQKDVIAGGQGAPLVPIGDQQLYFNYADAFLNIGGFCNICIPGSPTLAFDICPGNLPMNRAANSLGFEYDEGGTLAQKGQVDDIILSELNSLSYYQQHAPKSLGTEWLEHNFYPILNKIESPHDQLATIVAHESDQIAQILNNSNCISVLISGGGAYNEHLIAQLRSKTRCKIIIPSKEDIDFKESIIFGFLGALYLSELPNVIPSVTGASKAVIGGVLHLP